MLAMYMPADALSIDPKAFLLVSTIIVNILTFVGLYFVLKAILKYFSVKSGGFFNLSMLWLATVSGSVFWVQFTNSRNIELVAGLLLLYLGLLLYRSVTHLKIVAFLALAAIIYFADPMQLMVTSVALVLYVLADSCILKKDRKLIKKALIVAASVAVGYLLSLLLIYLVKHLTNVDFFNVSSLSQSLAVFSNIPTAAIEAAKNTIRLVAGTNEMGSWRQVANVILVVALGVAATFSAYKMYRKNSSLVLFIWLLVIIPLGVYVASGQPVFKADTSRYLIVLAPALILLFSLIDTKALSRRIRFLLLGLGSLVVIASAVSLVVATVKSVPGGILNSSGIQARYQYLERSGYNYGYASMDTAIPAEYLYGKNSASTLLPLSCDRDRLRKVTLFFDKNVFTRAEDASVEVPIVLDGDSIQNHPNKCDQAFIERQLGAPIRVDTYRNNTVLIYDEESVSQLAF